MIKKGKLPTVPNSMATFLFENSCCSFLKTLLVTDITQILNEAKNTCTCVDQRFSGNFIGARALLGIFTCICRQRPIIHWWRWWSGALAAWHRWCGRSQNSTGINWIPIECSSEKNAFWCHTRKLLVKVRYLQNFFHCLCKRRSAYTSPLVKTHRKLHLAGYFRAKRSASTLAICHWKFSLCLSLSAAARGANCPRCKLQ